MSQEQWQDTLTDAAKTDNDDPPWEFDVYLVIQFMLLRTLPAENSPPPVRRKSAIVPGKCLHALHPSTERGIIHFHRQETGCQLARLGSLERPAQQLKPGKDDHVYRGETVSDHPIRLGQARLNGARLARGVMHRFRHLLGVESLLAENRIEDGDQVRLDVRLVLADYAHDYAGFLGGTAENRRLRILQVQVVQHRQRLETHIVAILEHGHFAAPIEREHLRRFVLLLRKLQHVARVRQALVFEREQHPPRVRTAAAPINVDRHLFLALNPEAIVSTTGHGRKLT